MSQNLVSKFKAAGLTLKLSDQPIGVGWID